MIALLNCSQLSLFPVLAPVVGGVFSNIFWATLPGMEASEAPIAAPLPGFPADDQGFLWLWDRHGRAQRVEILMALEYGDWLLDDKKSGLSHPHHTASTACPRTNARGCT